GRALVANGNTATAIVYDPATASWTPTGAMSVSRGHSAALRLANDKVLVTGGSSLASSEIYDPVTNDWTPTGAMSQARMFHRLTLLPDGRVMVTGGIPSLGGAVKTSVELYDPGAGLWSVGPSMSAARQEHTATLLLNGTVLVAGGQNLASTEIYDPGSNTWAAGVSMSLARTSHSATLLLNGSVLVASGGAFSKTAEYYSQGLGAPCTTNNQCPSGFCVDGVCCNVACNAGACDACSIAAGAPTDGTCAPVPDGTMCNDGNGCTLSDTCQAGACTGANPVVCAPADACHDAALCDAATGACDVSSKVNGTACNDGNACTLADSCQAGVCTGASPVACAPPDQCHQAGACDPATGACTYAELPNGAACNDGNGCTQSDTCQAGVCTGANPVVCAPPDQCHQAAACDAATGACTYANKPDGTVCNDNTLCAQGDACVAGSCVGASLAACTPCTTIRRDLGGTVADAAIMLANASTNYGSWNTLLSGIWMTKPVVSLLRFDLAAIPAGSTVISADLKLTALMISGASTVGVHRVNGGWNEATTKWNNFFAGFNGVPEASLPTSLGLLSFNVANVVQQWLNGAVVNNGVAVVQNAGYLYYASSERAGPVADLPTLKVCYQLP
ncbi:MAG: DNRLRE domain-containing protein, partial [Minicystis sp.]